MSPRAVTALPSLSLAVDERCTDLLLLEEFYASAEFCDWFLARTVGAEWAGAAVREVGRSVVRYGRESDLEVGCEHADGRRLRLLIENKIKAVFQKGQVEEYAHRAARYVEQGECDVARTVLVAPRAYGAAERFDHTVHYEQIRDWYMARKNARDRYRARVFQSGIDKAEGRTYSEPDAKVSEFWLRYYQLACDEAPALHMRDPRQRGANGTVVEFKDAGLPQGVVLAHKMRRAIVDLELRGMGARTAEVERHFGPCLPPDAEVVRASGSAAIRVAVPAVSVWDPFRGQIEAVRAGQQAAVRLLEWMRAIPDAWERWHDAQPSDAAVTATPEA
jgi:hypothetical protein